MKNPNGKRTARRCLFGVMCVRRPRCKRNLTCGLRSGASHVSGLFARRVTAGPDVVRGSGPNQSHGLRRPMTLKRVFPIDGSTVSHHAIITLAIRLSCADVITRGHAEPLQAAAASTGAPPFSQDRPRNARHLVGDRNGDQLSRLLGQQTCDPGILLRTPETAYFYAWVHLSIFGRSRSSF